MWNIHRQNRPVLPIYTLYELSILAFQLPGPARPEKAVNKHIRTLSQSTNPSGYIVTSRLYPLNRMAQPLKNT